MVPRKAGFGNNIDDAQYHRHHDGQREYCQCRGDGTPIHAKERASAGTQHSSGSNLGAQAAEELSVSGSGIPANPPTRCGNV
jgi:hypothetical protein